MIAKTFELVEQTILDRHIVRGEFAQFVHKRSAGNERFRREGVIALFPKFQVL